MRKKLKLSPLLALLAGFLLFHSCTEDDYEIETQESGTYSSQTINLNQLKRELGNHEIVNKLHPFTDETVFLQKGMINGYYVDDEIIHRLENEEMTTYTFKVYSEEEDVMKNLVLISKNGKIYSTTIDYYPTEEYKSNKLLGLEPEFTGDIKVKSGENELRFTKNNEILNGWYDYGESGCWTMRVHYTDGKLDGLEFINNCEDEEQDNFISTDSGLGSDNGGGGYYTSGNDSDPPGGGNGGIGDSSSSSSNNNSDNDCDEVDNSLDQDESITDGINELITDPILEFSPPDACTVLQNLLSNEEIKSKIESLKTQEVFNLNYEKGYDLCMHDESLSVVSNDGNENNTSVNVIVPEDGSLWGFMHSHYYGLSHIFTIDDLYVFNGMYQWAKYNGAPVNKLTATVVSYSGVYTLFIEDEEKFIEHGNAMHNGDFYTPDTGIKDLFNDKLEGNLSVEKVERIVMDEFLKYGIAIYKADNNLTNWNKMEPDPNDEVGIVLTECN